MALMCLSRFLEDSEGVVGLHQQPECFPFEESSHAFSGFKGWIVSWLLDTQLESGEQRLTEIQVSLIDKGHGQGL